MTLQIHIGHASRPKPGEVECGDQVGVVSAGDRHLAVVADGLGHGPDAAAAARQAVDFLLRDPWGDLTAALQACDRALTSTRGACITMLRIDAAAATLTHVGIGNVEVHGRTREPLRVLNIPGVVGARLRRVQVNRSVLHAGDLVLVHTDGVSSRLDLGALAGKDAMTGALDVLRLHAKDHDDAACLVIACEEAR